MDMEEPIIINGIRQRGIDYTPADKSPGSRVQGWQAIRSGLHNTVPGANGMRERPGLFFTRDCKNLIETLQALPRDLGGNIEDCPDKGCIDHLPDALRYLLRRSSDSEIAFCRHDRRLQRDTPESMITTGRVTPWSENVCATTTRAGSQWPPS